ncbi:MAG: B12-binding domain-containing radical SAM protein [Deltaproteobacteria bacterium]|nr:B12-binding domain-containing radical SAM protein [Deltaproteobacteria bacterium]
MRVALCAPRYPLSEAPSPPLGLSYVAAVFREQGAEVKIFDYIVAKYSKEKLEGQLRKFSPDVLGVGSVTMNIHHALEILADAKDINPEITTFMGGPHVSFCAEEILQQNSFVDLIIIGESEGTIRELLPLLKAPSRWSNVCGIAFRDHGGIVITPTRRLLENIDNIPLPARDLLPLSRYKALGFPISMLTSRGCPYKCIFCQGRRLVGAEPRLRAPRLVVDEIESILALGFDRINIADDLFMINAQRAQSICEEIIRRGLNFTWSAFVRANTVDGETMRLMKKAGCSAVSFGVESGNPKILKEIKKGITLEMARSAVKICQDAGLVVLVSFIAGLPSETAQTLRATKEFADSIGCHYGFHILAPFLGTTIREEAGRYDMEIISDDWSLYDANHAVTRTSSLSPKEIEGFVHNFEDELNVIWQEQVRCWRKKINSPEVEMRVEGHQRMNLIFQLLTEDWFDDYSPNGETMATDICQQIAHNTGFERGFVSEVIANLLARRLIMAESGGGYRWA